MLKNAFTLSVALLSLTSPTRAWDGCSTRIHYDLSGTSIECDDPCSEGLECSPFMFQVSATVGFAVVVGEKHGPGAARSCSVRPARSWRLVAVARAAVPRVVAVPSIGSSVVALRIHTATPSPTAIPSPRQCGPCSLVRDSMPREALRG